MMFTRRTVLGGLAATPLVGTLGLGIGRAFAQPALEGDTIETSAGPVIIHPVGHASLALGWDDQVVYVDPVGAEGFAQLPPATAVLITHEHGDHFDLPTLEAVAGGDIPLLVSQTVYDGLPEPLQARATPVANGTSTQFAGVPIDVVAAYNTTPDRQQYHPQGVGNGYVLTLGDKKIYIAGDTELTPEMEALSGIEVAFLPMNLPYTMTEEQAAEAVKAFSPRIVYPYHYRGSDTAKFAELVGDAAEVRLVDWYANAS